MIESNNILNTDNSDGLSSALKDLNEIELAIPISSTHTSASAPPAPPLQHLSILNSYVSTSAFNEKINRLWLHTCSLDHKNALNNYKSRGMKVFKEETLKI